MNKGLMNMAQQLNSGKHILAVDTHLHAYRCYDINVWFKALSSNLARTNARKMAGCLVTAASGGVSLSELAGLLPTVPSASDWQFDYDEGAGLLSMCHELYGELALVAGHQLVSSERLEVLALLDRGSRPRLEGCGAQELIDTILERDALPVLSWAPGKWWGKRGEIVKKLLDLYTPDTLLLGDSALRPAVLWPLPFIMRRARRDGFSILSGSDPLPLRGAEITSGCFATCCVFPGNEKLRPENIKNALMAGNGRLPSGGSRLAPWTVFAMLLRHRHAKSSAGTDFSGPQQLL